MDDPVAKYRDNARTVGVMAATLVASGGYSPEAAVHMAARLYLLALEVTTGEKSLETAD